MPLLAPLRVGRRASSGAAARQCQSAPPPVIMLGGRANALSVARSLGRRGVPIYSLNHQHECVRYSRFVSPLKVAVADTAEDAWMRFLSGPDSDWLRGAVLLACSDDAIELLMQHRDVLARKFRLDEANPEAQLCMLDKLATYQAALAACVPTPRFRAAATRGDVETAIQELAFPLLVKPLLSHRYQKGFGKKCAFARSATDALAAYDAARAVGLDVFLVEFVPGPPDGTWTYYTYLDENGAPAYEFVKRVLRRFPADTGIGCFEISERCPELRELSLKLLRHVGLRGLAAVEFKRDERDQQLKLIECNARLSGATCLLAACGIDPALVVYNRILGRALKLPTDYRVGVRLWYPYEDFLAFRQMRRAGLISSRTWLRSLLCRKILPIFRWSDPLPSLANETSRLKGALGRRLRRCLAGVRALFRWKSP